MHLAAPVPRLVEMGESPSSAFNTPSYAPQNLKYLLLTPTLAPTPIPSPRTWTPRKHVFCCLEQFRTYNPPLFAGWTLLFSFVMI